MFGAGEGYEFVQKGNRKMCDGELCFRRHTFSFKSNQTYLVEVDEFEHFLLHIVKFYLKAHRQSDKKFQMLTGLNEAIGLITTCVNIMVDFYERNPYNSFGFIGASCENEAKAETKRFKIYEQVMKRVFSPVKFVHHVHKPTSVYLLLNRDYAQDKSDLIPQIESFFQKHYDLG